ncbi:MAG TPA: aldehyde dehydrogenase family protein, partial [Oligoflexia bacterium]|nr:aldehyde dehydrogenase family protein [Oligoflexia bacterium]
VRANQQIDTFVRAGGLGKDPFAQVFEARRKAFSLFSQQLHDAEIEKMRRYIFNYDRLPTKPGDTPAKTPNLIAGEWVMAAKNEKMLNPGDRRIALAEMPDSGPEEVDRALTYAFEYWKSLKWTDDTLAYRKQVVKNFSRILNYYYEECLTEIRVQIPKTRLEADKDFWEGKRAADHLEGSAERAMLGEIVPTMIEGHTYWKNKNLPAGVSAIFTPMNFIYGIPCIQFIGAYLVGAPFVLKGHPLSAIATTTMMRMLMAAGADPRMVQKIEGFGKGIESLVHDHRVAIVSVTGSDATAARMQSLRGVRPVRFEGGGCNWSYIDDGYSDEELQKIAIRLTYSKLGFSSHKCTTLHGIAASSAVLSKILPMINREMDEWKLGNPTAVPAEVTKIVGPCMVHKAQTATDIQEAAEKIGAKVYRKGGRVTGGEYAENAEVIAPIILSNATPDMTVKVNWDGRGEKEVNLMTTEFFMPILVTSEMKSFSDFMNFCVNINHHDLAVSIWSRSDVLLSKARKVLGGMVKENDGTDSALEWEEFGASGVGTSGNMGVGDPEATFAIYSRRQKGRHVVF